MITDAVQAVGVWSERSQFYFRGLGNFVRFFGMGGGMRVGKAADSSPPYPERPIWFGSLPPLSCVCECHGLLGLT